MVSPVKHSNKLLPVEQLLTTNAQQKEESWLLPYLDVFVLLTMMFIVLLSMSSIDLLSSQSKVNQQQETISQLQQEIEPLRQLEMEGRSSLVLQHWQERIHQVLDSLKLRDDIALSLEDEYIALQIDAGTILVEGHTDNIPIETSQFPSNWELGAARASSVVKFLVSQGMDQQRLRAISYADTQPRASNDTASGRQQNRRVAMLLRMPDTE